MNIKLFALLLVLTIALSSASCQNITHTKIVGVREIDNKTEGIAADLTVEVKEGSGRVFVETKPLTQIDTQASARLAKDVACNILDRDCSKIDFFYIIESDFQIIGGPSAGSAMTAATLAALQGVEINKDVFVTGTINPAGSLGPIGSIVEKAEAAYSAGARIILIPNGQEMNLIEKTGETINITALAKKNWDMTVVPVNNIVEAYRYLTGYDIIIKKVTSAEIASQKYNDVMKILSQNLVNESKIAYSGTQGKFNSSTLSAEKTEEIEDILSQAQQQIDDASKSLISNNFYSASSFSVRSLISSYYAKNLLDYYKNQETNTTEDYIKSKMSSIKSDVSSFETLFLKNRKIDDLGDIEIYSVVIDRIREAEDILIDAEEAYNSNESDSALYLLAFAEVRKNTAYDWLTLISEFKGDISKEFDPSNVKDISQERITQSQTSIIYASTVAQNEILEGAQTHLDSAVSAFNSEKYIFALFEASKARAEANLAMEARALTNETVQAKITELEDEAHLAIKQAEEKGLLPILALSYLEFGKTLRNSDPIQALVYLSYSKEMAQISEDMVEATIGDNLLSNGVEITKYYEPTANFDENTIKMVNISVLAAGILCGALLSIYFIERKSK